MSKKNISVKEVKFEYSKSSGNVREVILSNGEVWDLNGKCNRCGACCANIKMSIPEYKNVNGGCNKFSFESIDNKMLGKIR